MKKSLLSFSILALIGHTVIAQNVNIPDANFKAYLVGQSGINLNMDSEIQVSEANSFSGTIDCGASSIIDLTGIEEFTALTDLNIYNNQVTSMDLSNNVNLINLYCNDNLLTSLDISNNTALLTLDCSNNPLGALDVSTNTVLTNLICRSNQLTNLDVSTNVALTYLNCQFNQITNLNLSTNAVLATLNCMFNQLTSLTFTNSISTFQCTNNLLTSLDLSGNTSLTVLTCGENQLTALNVKNGNNLNMNGVLFGTLDNPGLSCIEVDDAAYSAANWIYIDATTSFSIDCDGGLGLTTNELVTMTLYPNPATSNLTIETDEVILQVSIFNFDGKLVQNENSSTFSVENLETGIYNANVVTNNGVQTIRFIKE